MSSSHSEELMKPGERQLIEIRSYLFNLLDAVNSLVESNRQVVNKLGAKLLVSLELVTMQRYNLELVMREYWGQFKSAIMDLANYPELKDKMDDILNMANKIEELRKEAGFS
jgi:hypothetical protein